MNALSSKHCFETMLPNGRIGDAQSAWLEHALRPIKAVDESDQNLTKKETGA